MDYKKPKGNPEAKAANRLMRHMKARGWHCWKLGSSRYKAGWPDYYCYHHVHGHRWIETKFGRNKLEASQVKKFRELTTAGDKVYVCTDERHYYKLFELPNWVEYIRGVV